MISFLKLCLAQLYKELVLDQGNFVELESFTPQHLMRILNRGIASSQRLDISETGSIIWVGDSGSIIYAVESFG